MESWDMFIDFFLIAGMSFLALLIFFLSKSKTDFSKKLLIVFFANAFFFLLYYYGYLHRSRSIGAIAILFGHGVGYLLGPMMLYLLKSLVFPKERIIKPLLKNLIPFFVIFVGINIPLAVSMVSKSFRPYHELYNEFEPVLNSIENLYFIVYLIITYRFLKRLRKTFRENYSTLDKNNLDWYSYLIIGFLIIVIADSLCTVYELFNAIIPWNIGTIIAFSFVVLYLLLGYKGLFQSRILMPDFLLHQIEGQNEVPAPVEKPLEDQEIHLKSAARQLDSFSDQEIAALKQRLTHLLDNEKVYLNEELSLTELSDKLGVSNKKLSELLNQHLHTSFYTLINDYRINEVKRRLDAGDAEKYTVVSIAYDSGFQSKASFYRIFKQKEGISPSDYRKKVS
jgi:AraC-like DNA-binding protein